MGIVVWQSVGQDGSDSGVYGQLYNADGTKLNSEFRVNTYTAGKQHNSNVESFSDGKFIVVWQSFGQDDSNYGVYGQRYNADGTKLNSEFLIHEYGTDRRPNPNIGTFDDGKFIVVWSSNAQDDSGDGVYGQLFNFGIPGKPTTPSTTSSPTPSSTIPSTDASVASCLPSDYFSLLGSFFVTGILA